MTGEKTYRYLRAGRIRKLKDGADHKEYEHRHPDAVRITGQVPTIADLEEWVSEGICEAMDGCSGIEPDGTCEHGHPSWLVALGMI